ncbi:hypothetical protein Btru_036700 [Bulinus truncatus]|nr:hypothetical protein Btru_036700 [Bulinus truncatus]
MWSLNVLGLMAFVCVHCTLNQRTTNVYIKLLTYINPRGDLSDGRCCDQVSQGCQSQCDHQFTLCLDQLDGPKDDNQHCTYGNKTTGVINDTNYVTFNDTIGGQANPLAWGLPFWPGGVLLKITVEDDGDGAKPPEQVDYLDSTLAPKASVHSYMQSRTVLTLQISVHCEPDFYGHNCSVHCRKPTDHDHYRCDTRNGTKICTPGWEGVDCDLSIFGCSHATCHSGGTCEDRVTDYHCHCRSGFEGRRCESDIDECLWRQSCVHGQCANLPGGFSCTCHKGYKGTNCSEDIDECSGAPCLNGALCIDTVAGYTCSCATGYTGPYCEQDVDECRHRPCRNNGTCMNLFGNYQCNCPTGFQGPDCVRDVDECEGMSRCLNGGSCFNFIGGFRCNCPEGFTGINCEEDVNECLKPDVTCKNGATCMNLFGNYSCTCLVGYRGRWCQDDINECLEDPRICQHQGICMNLPGHFICSCKDGYTGSLCENNINECLSSVCQNGGLCTDLPGTFHCACTDFWEGPRCEVNVNECLSHPGPCFNNGTCADVTAGYTCACAGGYEGKRCERDIDECRKPVCMNRAPCVNTIGGFACNCSQSWTGARCEVDVDECAAAPRCHNWGDCVNTNGSYHCRCPVNWTGRHCEVDLDECALGIVECRNGGTCVNMKGKYRCECPYGWTGAYCETDLDECRFLPDACRHIGNSTSDSLSKNIISSSSLNSAICLNTQPGFLCLCPQGMTGWNCDQDIDECADGLQAPLLTDRSTVPDNRTYSFRSLREMISSGIAIDIDIPTEYKYFSEAYKNRIIAFRREFFSGVSLPACQHGGSCTNTAGGYRCNCVAHYTGENCETLQCDLGEEACNNHGECVKNGSHSHCVCSQGWRGDRCSWKSRCGSMVCMNGGTCEDSSHVTDAYICRCRAGWGGGQCQDCVGETCKVEGALCGDGTECHVNVEPVGGKGNNSALNRNSSDGSLVTSRINAETSSALLATPPNDTLDGVCSGEYCQMGGACFHTTGGAVKSPFGRCRCSDGWVDRKCNSDHHQTVSNPPPTTMVDSCADVVCQNQGVCHQSGSSWECTCAPGWVGIHCELNLTVTSTVCAPEHCHHHGRCHLNSTEGPICYCDPPWTGEHCNSSVDVCSHQPCQNKGVCQAANTGYSCHCPGMWTGVDCTFIELSIPFYLACNVSKSIAWKVDSGLKDLLSATHLYENKKLNVSHKSRKGRTSDGKLVTAIYPVVRIDQLQLSRQEIVYALNKLAGKFQDYMLCPVYLDAVENSQFALNDSPLNSEVDNWYPALIAACAFLLIGLVALTIIKCRRLYRQYREKYQLSRSRQTLSFRNQLYSEASTRGAQEMVENHINIIATGTVTMETVATNSPHYATVDEMQEIQHNTVTRVDLLPTRPDSGDGRSTTASQPISAASALERSHQRSNSEQGRDVNSNRGSRGHNSVRSKLTSSTGKQDPLPPLPAVTYHNQPVYKCPPCSACRPGDAHALAASTSDGGVMVAGADAPLYVDTQRRKRSGKPRQRPVSVDEKSLYKKRNSHSRCKKRLSDVDRKYKHLPYIDEPPYPDVLLQPHLLPSLSIQQI